MTNQVELPVKALLVDDHKVMLEGLRVMLTSKPEIHVEGTANSAEEALNILAFKSFDVVVVDIQMEKISGIDLTRRIRSLYPKLGILALTMYNDRGVISQMVDAGANGYVLKSSSIEEVTQGIIKVARGDNFLSTDVQSIILENVFLHDDAICQIEPNVPRLTKREAEILELIIKEYTNEQIGEKLFISPRTVESHRKNIFIKTGAKTIIGLVKYAIENGLIEK